MIYSLVPSVQRKIWGGNKLAALKNLPPAGELPVGETWEVSTHPEGPCFINGKALQLPDERLPYLVKLIDTGEALSVQVHPDDEYAQLHELSQGKTECWLILETLPGAGIYLGLKSGITQEEFKAALEASKPMNDYLNFYSVRPGDFYFVPPGSIHAIGAGVTLAEIQQNSGITYRVWDWNRVDSTGKGRELHVDKSMDVINFEAFANQAEFFKFRQGLFNLGTKVELCEHECFSVTLYNLRAQETLKIALEKRTRLSSLLNLGQKIKLNSITVDPMSAVLIENEDSIVVESFTGCSFILIE